jgi:outer membrane protein TolC
MEEVIAHSINQLSERLRETKNLAQQGLAIDADVLTVEARLSDLRLKLLEAQSAVRIARMTLNAQVGLPLDAVTRLVDVPSLPTAAAESADELAMLIKHARERRPDLKAMQRRTAVAEAGVVAARGGWFPQIALSANYDYARPNPRIIPSKDRWEGSWDVGVTLQWNVWDWSATSSQTAQAEANRAHSDALLEQLNDAVALDVAQQYFRRKEAIERIAVAELGVRQASESHRITTERFRQGLVTNSDMLTAETALLQARVAHTHALIDYLLATARLETAVGGNE